MSRLVLLSGGMDSTTALAQACFGYEDEVRALSVGYGAVHGEAEYRAAIDVAARMRVYLERIQLANIFAGGKSALMGDAPIPNEEYHDPRKETPSATVVPFRNANFISAAVAIAEGRGYDEVWIAVHGTDALGWAYPDCSPEFIGAMMNAVYIGTMRKVRLIAPFMWDTKADIVRKAVYYHAPLHLTWSCYRGEDVHCGNCPTCRERISAFETAGFVDPVEYAEVLDWPDGLKEFPK